MSGYTELHLHDHFSTLDGLNTPAEYMARAKEMGITHLAQTNHGTMAGHREFQIAAKEAGITPILGIEAYISETDRFDKRTKASRTDGTSVYNHMILLAKDDTGLKTMNRLNSKAWSEGYYFKPRIDMDLLEEDNEGLIALSGCLNGMIAKAIDRGDVDAAFNIARRFKSIFGERFFIEVQGHNPVEINEGLLLVADTLGIKPVVTSDCHYARKEDLWIEEAMLILSTNPKRAKEFSMTKAQSMDFLERFNYMYPDRSMTFQEYQIYLRDRQDHLEMMAAQGFDRTDIVDNTMEIASMIGEYPFYQGLDLLPVPKSDPDALLEKKVFAGLKKKGKDKDQRYIDRANEELGVIKAKNFSPYFLLEENLVSWARGEGIRVGPGRGSAAGSVVVWALGVTVPDPIEYGLLFFRFINPERNDFPDIDTDFQASRRPEVKRYAERKFKNVASIATFTYFKDKQVVKDAARVLGVPVGEANKATKYIADYDDFLKSPTTKEFRSKYPEVVKLCNELRGRIKSVGMHPAGLVIANQPLENFMPIESASDKDNKAGGRVPLIPMDMDQVADIGGIKLDALGLKDLDVIDDTLASIKDRHGIDIDLESIPLDDRGVFEMLSAGYTKGVAQASGHTFTKWILENEVREFNDLVIGTSIARPGALNTVGEIFTRRRFGREKVSYVHPIMEKHLEETLGVIVYQEQVMLAMTDLAGMSMVEADKVRKIIGKKRDVTEFEAYRERFIEGASKHITREQAANLWHDFEAHAGYSFNKSHAVAYSMVTYWTAWLKHNYPVDFVYALLKREKDKDSITDYLIEAKRLGLKVLLPDVNKSGVDFTIEGDTSIRFGLANVKFISDTLAKRLIAARPFNTYGHLKGVVLEKGSGLNTRVLSSLNAIGGATFMDNPKHGKERDNLYEYLGIPAFDMGSIDPHIVNQFLPLDEYEETGAFIVSGMVTAIKTGPGWARIDMVDETGKASFFGPETTQIETGLRYVVMVSNNRMVRYATIEDVVNKERTPFIEYLYRKEYKAVPEGQYKVIAFTSRTTKAGKKMADVVLSTGDKRLLPVLVFPQKYHMGYGGLQENSVVAVDLKPLGDGDYALEQVL